MEQLHITHQQPRAVGVFFLRLQKKVVPLHRKTKKSQHERVKITH